MFHPIIKSLILTFSVHGGWGEYDITECTQPCGGGTQKKVKACNNPSPGQGGDNCPCDANEVCDGQTSVKEILACNLQPCTGIK